MEQAEALCDQLILLHHGQVRLAGTLATVRASEGRQAVHVRHRLKPGRDLLGAARRARRSPTTGRRRS